jgi:hypothetical protein
MRFLIFIHWIGINSKALVWPLYEYYSNYFFAIFADFRKKIGVFIKNNTRILFFVEFLVKNGDFLAKIFKKS